jgi:hypothetical protein
MISNAMFYRQDTQATTNKAGVLMKIGPIEFTLTQLWISFIGTLVVIPINLVIVTLFRKAKYSQRNLIAHHLQGKKLRRGRMENNEQYEKTKRFVMINIFLYMSKMCLCSFFGKRRYHSKLIDEEMERIGAIPSIEDKTRTLPHWTVYIAWGCKFNERERFGL